MPTRHHGDLQVMPNTKRILILSYYFPPLAGAATFRSLEFVKHLPEFGWQPIALSVIPTPDDIVDEELLEQIPASVPVARVDHLHPKKIELALLTFWKLLWKVRLRSVAHCLQPYRIMRWMVPDVHAWWFIPGLAKAFRLIRQYNPQVILTTAPPHTTHLIGLILKQQTGLLWIADYQDPWSQNPFTVYPTWLHNGLNRWLDRKTLQKADLVIGATDGITKDLQMLQNSKMPGHFGTVWLGYESGDFTPTFRDDGEHPRLRIVYIGSLYGLRRADWFLSTIDGLVTDGEIDGGRLSVAFVGLDGTGDTAAYTEKSWFTYQAHVPHSEALRMMVAADCLLLLVNPESIAQVPLKLFEYLGANRPVLGLAPPSSVSARIIKETGAGFIVPPNDTEALKTVLIKLFEDWREGRNLVEPSLDAISSYTRLRQVKVLAGLLDSMLIRAEE